MPHRVLTRVVLDVSFQALEAVTSGVPSLQVAGLVPAFRQPGDHFGILGAHRGTTGAADRTASWSMIFGDWRRISDRMLGVSEQSLVFEKQGFMVWCLL